MTFTNITRRRRWLGIVLFGITIVLFGIAIYALVITSTKTARFNRLRQQSDPTTVRKSVQPAPADEVSLSLGPNGFSAKEIRAHRRRFLLSLDNRTEVKELVLRLSDKDGKQLRELRVPGGGGDWGEMFDLQPGSYTFSEVNHTDWWCKIVVD